MNKIICLVDHTHKSENAVQYATHLALDTSSKLILVSLQREQKVKKLMVMAGTNDYASPPNLSVMCDQLRSVWKVRCDYSEVSSFNVEELMRQVPDLQLIIVGIEHAAKLNPFKAEGLSGIDFKMIRKSAVPILLVPEHFQYHRVARILYGYDYTQDATVPLDQLQHITEWLRSDILFLTVAQHKYSAKEESKIEERIAKIVSQWKGKRSISSNYIYYDDVAKCLDHYMELWKRDDILVFSVSRTPLVKRLFHKSIIKQITLCCDYPVMIIHRNPL